MIILLVMDKKNTCLADELGRPTVVASICDARAAATTSP